MSNDEIELIQYLYTAYKALGIGIPTSFRALAHFFTRFAAVNTVLPALALRGIF